ncbi:hypothetical protein GDO78_022502 [Eleutherodactylus coqui]|uniref:Uncharacterized protein n=1 Tax=Eleutherodactylus coqui TaxID=57060 RepID=A0A8J6EN31_ELECQ|nr:hypothetical protein GDO78_022502 [Eleutherodactylus coqui]
MLVVIYFYTLPFWSFFFLINIFGSKRKCSTLFLLFELHFPSLYLGLNALSYKILYGHCFLNLWIMYPVFHYPCLLDRGCPSCYNPFSGTNII